MLSLGLTPFIVIYFFVKLFPSFTYNYYKDNP